MRDFRGHRRNNPPEWLDEGGKTPVLLRGCIFERTRVKFALVCSVAMMLATLSLVAPGHSAPHVDQPPSFLSPEQNTLLYSQGSAEYRQEVRMLVEKFSPILVLTAEGTVRPVSVGTVAENLYVEDLRCVTGVIDAQSPTVLHRDRVPVYSDEYRSLGLASTGSLSKAIAASDTLLRRYYFALGRPGPTSTEKWYDSYKYWIPDEDLNYCYAHPFLSEGEYLVIQYWFFYPFNHWVNRHEGDWEHINVVLHWPNTFGGDWEKQLDCFMDAEIAAVEYYLHRRVLVLKAEIDSIPLYPPSHPIVYVGGWPRGVLLQVLSWWPERRFGRHSHASYPRPGVYDGVGPFGEVSEVIPSRPAPWRGATTIYPSELKIELVPDLEKVVHALHEGEMKHSWLSIPARWGFPDMRQWGVESVDWILTQSTISPWGPAFQSSWNRTAKASGHVPYATPEPRGFRGFLDTVESMSSLETRVGLVSNQHDAFFGAMWVVAPAKIPSVAVPGYLTEANVGIEVVSVLNSGDWISPLLMLKLTPSLDFSISSRAWRETILGLRLSAMGLVARIERGDHRYLLSCGTKFGIP